MKIIGATIGTTLPKPNFKQTDPTKGDYIKNKLDESDALELTAATGLIDPVTARDGSIYTSKNGVVYSLI